MNAYPNPKLPNFIQIWIYRFSGQMGPLWSAAWPPASRGPGNATRQFPRRREALPLCKSALSSPVTCLKRSLAESVKLAGGFQLCFSAPGPASITGNAASALLGLEDRGGQGCGIRLPALQLWDAALLSSKWLGMKMGESNISSYSANEKNFVYKNCSRSPWERQPPAKVSPAKPSCGDQWLRGSLCGHLMWPQVAVSFTLYHLLCLFGKILFFLFRCLYWIAEPQDSIWTVTCHGNLKWQLAISVGCQGFEFRDWCV